MKKYLIAASILILLSGVCGFIGSKSFTDAGILSMRTIEEAEKIPFHFYAIFDESDSHGFENYEDEYVEDYTQVECIAVVAPTGQIIQNGKELAQEVEVQKINKGNKELEGKKIYLSSTDGLAQMKGEKEIYYIGTRNLMQKDNKYLAFFHSIKLNEELGKSYYQLEDSLFSYLNLNKMDEGELIDTEKQYQLKDIKDKEFFTSSENALKGMNKIKQRMIEKYLE